MKKQTAAVFFAAVLISLLILPMFPLDRVRAATLDYPAQNVSLDIPDDVLIMTPTTPKYDEVWAKAGVTDPSAAIKEFQNMGVVAAFFDPDTKTTVNFISNRNTITADKFSLEGMTGPEVEEYISGLMGGSSEIEVDVRYIPHEDVPFFRLVIDGVSGEAKGREIIYGTIVNAQMLQFDVYTETIRDIDETFLLSVVDGIKITRLMTREDYEAEAKAALRKFFIGAGIFFGALVALVIYAIVRKRVIKRKLASISEAITNFRERRKNGAVDANEIPEYTARTNINDAALNTFGTFNTWIRVWPVLAVCSLLYMGIIWLMLSKGFPLYALVTVIAGIAVLYMHYTRLEKLKEAMKKRFKDGKGSVITVRFFGEYFTVSGLESISEYIYRQITAVSTFRDYIFIYTGDENAVMISKNGVEPQKADELIEMLKTKRKKVFTFDQTMV